MKMGLLFLLAIILAVPLLAFRLAPSDPARWHVDPAAGRAGANAATVSAAESPLFAESPADLLARLDAIALSTPRTRRLAGSPAEGRITWVTRSRVFGFPDYTSAAAVPDGQGARIVLFARARFGKSDLGVNRKRVDRWLAALEG